MEREQRSAKERDWVSGNEKYADGYIHNTSNNIYYL